MLLLYLGLHKQNSSSVTKYSYGTIYFRIKILEQMVLKLPFSFVFIQMPFVKAIVIPPFILKVIFSFSLGFTFQPIPLIPLWIKLATKTSAFGLLHLFYKENQLKVFPLLYDLLVREKWSGLFYLLLFIFNGRYAILETLLIDSFIF